MLYIMSFVKLVLPLLTMPYLTRVLSEESYGLMSYVRSYMTYAQLFIDFGFILSSVKDIVNAQNDKKAIGEIAGNTIVSKGILTIVAAVVMFIICVSMKTLRSNWLYVLFSFISVATTIFLLDFLFRGIEKMQYITIIFLITKSISTVLTFVFVKDDGDMIWIPILEIIAHIISAIISIGILKKLNIKLHFGKIRECIHMIRDSSTYFFSSVATTAFSALNTLIIGIYVTDLAIVAHWSLCLNIIGAIQGLYGPICNGVYPHMIKEKKLSFIHKVLMIMMPVVVLGCIFSFVVAEKALWLIGGDKYVDAAVVFRCMIPVLFFSFPAQLYGWPTLGAVGKVKETTISTVISAMIQIVGLFVLILCGKLNLIAMAFLRCFTEFCLMLIRMIITYSNKNEFKKLKPFPYDL